MEEARLSWVGMEKLGPQSSLRASRREEGDDLTTADLYSVLLPEPLSPLSSSPRKWAGRKPATSRRGWKEVAFNLRKGLLGTMSLPGPGSE